MDKREEMLSALRNRSRGFALSRGFYVDPEYFKLDMEMIWYKEWLFVAHECELPEPGSYVTWQLGDYPILVVRDRQQHIRAFHNACRHRGSRICSAQKGKATRLVCPYHQWTYQLDGSLMSARHMGADFDKSGHGLQPIACEVMDGYVFICLAQHPADFASVQALIGPYIAPHALRDAKVAHESTIVEEGNWKLVWENNRECYHCAANHPELCKTFPEAPSATGHSGVASDPELAAHWSSCERAGLPSRFKIDAAGQFRAVRTTLLNGAESYTSSGRRAVRRPLSDGVTKDQVGALLAYHYPSTWNHVLGDHAVTFRVTPLSASETAVTTKWLVHKDAVEGVEYDLEELIHVWTETNDEDRRVVQENAIGVNSPAYTPGPYSREYEDGVSQFIDWYAAFIEPRLGSDALGLRSVA